MWRESPDCTAFRVVLSCAKTPSTPRLVQGVSTREDGKTGFLLVQDRCLCTGMDDSARPVSVKAEGDLREALITVHSREVIQWYLYNDPTIRCYLFRVFCCTVSSESSWCPLVAPGLFGGLVLVVGSKSRHRCWTRPTSQPPGNLPPDRHPI